MALNFPSSPTDGQAYGNFIYSLSKGAWQAKPLTPGVATPSTVPPSSPKNGDEWFNTNDGSLYIYYNDGDTAQWVQVKSDATLSSTIGTRLEAVEAKPTGLVSIIPTSVTIASGTSSYNSTGVVTFDAASSVRLNGVFSSNYQDYRVQYRLNTSASTRPLCRFSKNGIDSSTSVYATANITYTQSTVYAGGATSAAMYPNSTVGVTTHSAEFTIYKPFDATAYTMAYSTGIGGYEGGRTGSVRHLIADTWDGFTVLPETGGTISGTIRVYGYR